MHKDYVSSRQQEETNLCDSDASGDDLSNLEAAGSPSSNLRPSLLIVGRKEDEEEEALVSQFLEDGCGCNKSCCQLFDQQSLEEIRSRMPELSSTELDLVVLGQIAAGLFAAELQGNTRGVHAKHDRERTYSAFRYHGQPICLKMFRFLHTIGTKQYSNLLKHYRTHGVPPRTHGNEK